MLAVGGCKQVGAVRHGNIEIIIVFRGMRRRIQGIIARIADWPGRQPFVQIGIVWCIGFEILLGQRTTGAAQSIQHRCVNFEIWEP